ncbi:LysR family transcriptional regulator [Thaumasiovibrio sp. DFM-14]|uniref:LysR family transcriptional regulator n=1 Tax=Thaumasiovibrio sp. DFM-14 TaxID=3384792 RepID=UPI0039A3D5B4
MNKLLSFEALQILDAIERRGSFAAAADELQRAPSSLSYQVQKLEQDLDLMIFDRSGHRAVFTKSGQLLLERGRQLLLAAEEMVGDAMTLAHGWELELTIGYDGIVDIGSLLPLVSELEEKGRTRLHFQEEILAGCWEALAQERVDLVIAPKPDVIPTDVKTIPLGNLVMGWVAHPDHPILNHNNPLAPQVRRDFRIVAVRDSAILSPPISYNILDKQSVMRVRSMTDKLKVLKLGLGIGTYNLASVQQELNRGELVAFGNEATIELEMVLAWRRSEMGKAKAWCIEHIPRLKGLR